MLVAAYEANNPFRGNKVLDTPANQGPSRTVSDGRSLHSHRFRVADRTTPLFSGWVLTRAAPLLAGLPAAALLPDVRSRPFPRSTLHIYLAAPALAQFFPDISRPRRHSANGHLCHSPTASHGMR